MNVRRYLWVKAINRRPGLAIVAGLAAALAGAGAARAADTPITSCNYTISHPGSYVLAMNLTCGSGVNGISIRASDVTLRLDGHTITGPNNGFGTGIAVYVVHNIQIEGRGLIQQFVNGIYLQNVSNSQVQGVVTARNSYGILSQGGTNLHFDRNVFAQNSGTATGGGPLPASTGIYLDGDSNDQVQENEATGNRYGILIASVSGNQVHDNSADGNSVIGIYIAGGSHNHIHDNAVFGNGTYGIEVASSAGSDIHDNIAEGNVTYDLFDNTTSPACDSDTCMTMCFSRQISRASTSGILDRCDVIIAVR